MADERLKWVFEILDKVSAPGRAMARSVGVVEKSISAAGRAARTAANFFGSFRHALFETTGILRNVWDFTRGLTSSVLDFGKALVKNATFQENTKLSLEFFMGSARDAADTFETLESIAKKSKQPIDAFVKAALPLARAGFSGREIGVLAQSLGDLAVVNPEGVGQFADILARIKSTGIFNSRDIRGLADAGIRGSLVFEELSRTFGLAGSSLVELEEQLDGGLKRLDPSAVLNALQRAAARAVGGTAGNALKRGEGTLQGTINAMGNLTDQLFDRIAGGKGFQAFRSVFTNLITALSPDGPLGKTFLAFINGPVANFLGQFSGPDGLKKIEGVFESINSAVSTTVGLVKDLTSAFEKLRAVLPSEQGGGVRGAVQRGFAPNPKNPLTGGIGDWFYDLLHPGESRPAAPAPALPPAPAPMPKDKTTGFNIKIEVNGSDNPQETAERTASALAAVLRNMGLEQGSA